MHCKKTGYKSPKEFRVSLTMALLLVVVFVISFAAEANFVASKNSEVFHVLTCFYVERIKEENKVFFDTYQAAVDSGRRLGKGSADCRKILQDDPAAQPLPDIPTTVLEPLEGQIRIAAFNIQVFGRATRENLDVMSILVQIAREFDIVFVQELKYADEQTAPIFLDGINAMDGSDYAFVRSQRLGRTTSKEAYAYFYNTETVDFIESSAYVYDDVGDVFEREPYIASFRSGNFDFTLVGVHVKPDAAKVEISRLATVCNSVLERDPSELDIIILGDFNADGSYFDENNMANPFRDSKFHWMITNDMDTMVKTDWTYDRIVMTEATSVHEYVDNSAAVFYFDQEYNIDGRLAEDVSDHFPVYTIFRTYLPDDDSGANLLNRNTKLTWSWGRIKAY